ncbi:RDD family protein [Labrys okinawensis]|uniref:RDD family protein n=1 Tax=Labrys okinawensis TaxID=346911 RepID=A0A2S9Q6U0_9HYPH|nr:RDD family protein [Labrys okinawensis]PRH85030.1 RDD family protein [Labrys okinawensis]
MPSPRDRVSQLLEGRQRRTREIVTPEGVAIHVEVADRGERLGAFLIDLMIWFGATILIWIALAATFLRGGSDVAVTVISFLSFLLRNLYFIHFELAWQGSTPGKRATGLKVIDRKGGVLTPTAVIARNLTREVEFFLPLQLFFMWVGASNSGESWQALSMLGWVVLLAALPFFNRDHLRAGDLIGGTLVIALPKRALALDLTQGAAKAAARYSFTSAQLQAYGAYELQVLEEILRRPGGTETWRIHREIAEKIIRRIGWQGTFEPNAATDFLQAFYAAERAELERGQLFGRYRDDKNSGTRKAGEPAAK